MSKILIAEDNSQDRYLMESLLKGNNYEVISAKNGKEALALARKEPPDMIISDLMMPVMDGFSFCRECKNDDLLKSIPFVCYSATYITPKDVDFAISIGAVRFIYKPQEPKALVKKLKEVFEEHSSGKFVATQNLKNKKIDDYRLYNEVLIKNIEQKITQIQRQIGRRNNTEKNLLTYLEHLELIVKERTALHKMLSLNHLMKINAD